MAGWDLRGIGKSCMRKLRSRKRKQVPKGIKRVLEERALFRDGLKMECRKEWADKNGQNTQREDVWMVSRIVVGEGSSSPNPIFVSRREWWRRR